MTDSRATLEEISTYIDATLRRGFDSAESAAESAINVFDGDDGFPGNDAVSQLAAEKLSSILEEQKSWARPTDAERLDAAFRRLNAAGILARHNYAPTRTWGLGELREEAEHAASRGLSAHGYVYYTSQDAEALDDGCLHLAFGAFSEPGMTYAQLAEASHAVAEQIHRELNAEGLQVDWDGGLDSTMQLFELSWKCPRDPASGDSVLKNDRTIAPEVAPRVAKAESPSLLGWPLTQQGEWWLVVTFIAFDGSNAADVALEIVHDSLLPDAQATAHRGPGALDFVLGGFELAGKPVRLDLITAPSHLLHVGGRQRSVQAADVVIAIVRDPEDRESVAELKAWISESKRERPVIVLIDAPARALAKSLAASFPYEQIPIDFEQDVRPVMTAVKQALKHGAMQIRDRAGAR